MSGLVRQPRRLDTPKAERLYLIGRMTGLPKFGYPDFISAAERLRARGYAVISPVELDSPAVQEAAMRSQSGDMADLPDEFDMAETILSNVRAVILSDGLAVVNDISRSRGAKMEVAVADRLELPTKSVDDWISYARYHLEDAE